MATFAVIFGSSMAKDSPGVKAMARINILIRIGFNLFITSPFESNLPFIITKSRSRISSYKNFPLVWATRNENIPLVREPNKMPKAFNQEITKEQFKYGQVFLRKGENLL